MRDLSGDALQGETYGANVRGHDTVVHLVGVAHPSPAKAREFREIDLRAGLEAIKVAARGGVRHFVYVSVAQPAPVMKVYLEVRAECEAALRESGMNATVLRPWYVLGPGHRWPIVLKPFYAAAEMVPGMREGALRLGLVTIDQMLRALANVVDDRAEGVKIIDVAGIRRMSQ